MRMGAENQVCTVVDGSVSELNLCVIRGIILFHAPVEIDNHQLRTVFFDSIDHVDHIILTVDSVCQFVDTDHAYFYTIYFFYSITLIAKGIDFLSFDIFYGILVSLISIVMAMVIGQINGFYAACRKDSGIRRISLKGKFLIFPFRRIRQRSLQIDNRQIIIGEGILHISEEIGGIVFFLIFCLKTGGFIEVFIGSEGTVPGSTDYNGRSSV